MSIQWDLQDHDLDQEKIRQRSILLESKDYSFMWQNSSNIDLRIPFCRKSMIPRLTDKQTPARWAFLTNG